MSKGPLILTDSPSIIVDEPPREQTERIIPLGDRLLIRVHDPDSQTAGGLIIPENARGTEDRHRRGEVLAVGSKVPEELKPGLLVAIPNNYTGDEVLEAKGRQPLLILISAERVSAIIEKIEPPPVTPTVLQ
jgi:co-chaperonin GroES (HSP10)